MRLCEKVTGLSEAQTTRLIRMYLDHGALQACTVSTASIPDPVRTRGHHAAGGSGPFARAVERAGHASLSGTRVTAIWDKRYERLSKISEAHLYNLRASARYRSKRSSPSCVKVAKGVKPFKDLVLVGPPGFEPGTSCTPSKRASQAAPRPDQHLFYRTRLLRPLNPYSFSWSAFIASKFRRARSYFGLSRNASR
jgi:hypothetical protein